MKMQPTQGVSFPRSGHAAIFLIARQYFGDAFIYCDTNSAEFCGCDAVPCVNPARTFAKNHDFGLRRFRGVRILKSEHYFIQYRSPVRSIVSNFYLHKKNFPDRGDRKGWMRFARKEVGFWNRFVDKWVLNFPSDAAAPLYCTYEALIEEPEIRVREILSFLSNGPLDDEAVGRAVEAFPIAARDNLADFEFFDTAFFRELEDKASDRLARLGLPSYADEL
jgi:hypothetical protein